MCALPKRVLQPLDFTVNRVLMKLVKSCNILVIEQYSSRDVLRNVWQMLMMLIRFIST